MSEPKEGFRVPPRATNPGIPVRDPPLATVLAALPLDPTFEADPIGRRLECLPKKGININLYIILKVFLMGPRGPQGLIKISPGALGPGD